MAHYLKLREKEIREFSRLYQFHIDSFKAIEQGSANTNFLINTNQGKYILTIFEITPEHLVSICKVLRMLEKHTYPAPRIYHSTDGEMLTHYHGKPVLVKPYIKGQVIGVADDNQLQQLGNSLACLHWIPCPNGIPDQHRYLTENYPTVIEKGNNQGYLNWLKERYDYLTQHLPAGLPAGLIHGDLFIDNVLFDGKKLIAVLDFEDACHYYKVFDIGMAIVGLCTKDASIQLRKANAFVRGYQQIRLLEADEREYLQASIELAAVLTSAWRYWKYHIDTPDDFNSKKYMEMVKIAVEIEAMTNTVFNNSVFGNKP